MLSDFFSTLQKCRRLHSSLATLDLDTYQYGGNPPVQPTPLLYLIDTPTLRLLFCFQNLTCLIICAVGFNLDDSVIAEMARRWPQLCILQLIGRSPSTVPCTTLKSLEVLARPCPHLESLFISIDASEVPELDRTSLPPAQTAMVDLNVGHSPLSNPLSVARYISGIFTDLDSVSTYDTSHGYDDYTEIEETEELWADVNAHIPIVKGIREEGRSWEKLRGSSAAVVSVSHT
ncbi:hypothetical protein B0H16DRAFT_898118 [Mycena metata]|uniref:F-box protein n=1 Tax=Mycena metata TaxID=1033252 RepID=A0AAD7IRG4_9AGAR|nr:hypothetical protein B0H16DRAFT_898118 [Mycena metata]